jgi:hypothetical protein
MSLQVPPRRLGLKPLYLLGVLSQPLPVRPRPRRLGSRRFARMEEERCIEKASDGSFAPTTRITAQDEGRRRRGRFGHDVKHIQNPGLNGAKLRRIWGDLLPRRRGYRIQPRFLTLGTAHPGDAPWAVDSVNEYRLEGYATLLFGAASDSSRSIP